MAKNLRWSPDDLKKKRYIQVDNGDYVPVERETSKKVDKLPNLLERAVGGVKEGVNQKVRNATKKEIDGIVFDSTLEAYMYTLLKGARITFERQKLYVLQDRFIYRGQTVRAITLCVDFWLPTHCMLIDPKGQQTQQGIMRWKMLKKVLVDEGEQLPTIEMPSNKKECDVLLNRLLYCEK